MSSDQLPGFRVDEPVEGAFEHPGTDLVEVGFGRSGQHPDSTVEEPAVRSLVRMSADTVEQHAGQLFVAVIIAAGQQATWRGGVESVDHDPAQLEHRRDAGPLRSDPDRLHHRVDIRVRGIQFQRVHPFFAAHYRSETGRLDGSSAAARAIRIPMTRSRSANSARRTANSVASSGSTRS